MTSLVQTIAEHMCRVGGDDPHRTIQGKPVWRSFLPEARELLGAMVKGATPYMIASGRQRLYDSPQYEMMAAKVAGCWEVMCLAALEEEA